MVNEVSHYPLPALPEGRVVDSGSSKPYYSLHALDSMIEEDGEEEGIVADSGPR